MLSERIKYLRREQSYTQLQLAKQLGVTANTVGMYEQGRREPSEKILRRMSEVFCVSTEFLLWEQELPEDGWDEMISQIKVLLIENKYRGEKICLPSKNEGQTYRRYILLG